MERVSVCLSFFDISTTVHPIDFTLGVLLRTQGSAVSSVKLFGWVVLEKAASSNTGSQAIEPFWTGAFWMGTALVLNNKTWECYRSSHQTLGKKPISPFPKMWKYSFKQNFKAEFLLMISLFKLFSICYNEVQDLSSGFAWFFFYFLSVIL